MDKFTRLIDTLQDLITQLEEVRVNLRKLAHQKRVPETLSKHFVKAKSFWKAISTNYESLGKLSPATATDLLPKYEAAKAIFCDITEFIRQTAPDLLDNENPDATTSKINPSKDSTSDNMHESAQQHTQLQPQDATSRQLTATTSNVGSGNQNDDKKEEKSAPGMIQQVATPDISSGAMSTGLDQYYNPQVIPPVFQQGGSVGLTQPTPHSTQPVFIYVPGVGYVQQNPPWSMSNIHIPQNSTPVPPPIPVTQSQTSEALLHAIAKLMLDREQAPNPEGIRSGVKIPEVKLREYNGDITKYREFKEQFNSLVENSRTSSIDRFNLLKSKLTGKALEAICALDLTEDNYPIAWSTLDKTFDNPKHLAKVELEAMLALPQRPTKSGNAESIISYMHYTKSRVSNLKRNGITDDHILAYLILRGFDPITRGRMEDFVECKTRLPTLQEIEDFMFKEYQHHLDQDDGRQISQQCQRGSKNETRTPNTKVHATVQPSKDLPKKPTKCFICSEKHTVVDCPKFLGSNNREALLRDHKICIYCVKHRFDFRSPCKSRDYIKCDTCKGSHITEMHPLPPPNVVQANTSNNPEQPAESSNIYLCKNESDAASEVLLPTAIAQLLLKDEVIPVRCLLDQSSQANYISEDLVQKLRLPKKRTHVKVIGVGGEIGTVRSVVHIKIKLDHPEIPFLETKALVVKRVTSSLPSMARHIPWKNTFKNPLADPHFNKPAHIPLLLGSPVYSTVLRPGLEKRDGLLLQDTHLGGWIVSGGTGRGTGKYTSSYVTTTEFESQLLNFWDMPITTEDITGDDSEFCEKLFTEKYSRNEEGRYIVPIPWKTEAPSLGNSYRNAVRFYMGQERRWQQDETHKKMSNDFMQDYLDSNHMSAVPIEKQRDETGNAYYIPYLSIIRKNAITTKLRNVFNASAPSSNGVSLNQLIHPGPKLQSHIFDIILQNRQYEYSYTSDMKQMFRQFLIPEEDRDKLRILWRPNKDQPLGEFWLHTVTYGIDCAPWQAIRTVQQIAEDNAPDEETKSIIKNSVYMDDLFHGADSIQECRDQISKVTATLEAGKLTLTKWSSNNPEILHDIDESKKLSAFKDDSNAITKVLGIYYNQHEDSFLYRIEDRVQIKFTKRGLLSIAASLYDPMGWILPVIMLLRIKIQELWMQKYDWDDKIDERMQQKFGKILESLSKLNHIRISRWVGSNLHSPIQLIGFCDASGNGYAAVIYSKVRSGTSNKISLLAAKGRVTPLKTRINTDNKLCTIPKLELEGIVLLTELYKTVRSKFRNAEVIFRAYTDSEVALAWVRNSKEIENKFVKRRVAKIKKVINPADLHYVKSTENPADPASRGLLPGQLANSQLWFEGPPWLKIDPLPSTPYNKPEFINTHATQSEKFEENFIERFSCIKRLLRVTAYCLRWAHKKEDRPTGAITAEEISIAKIRIIRYQQQHTFAKEIDHIRKSKLVPKNNWLASLSPIIGPNDNILRVGGRISHATLPENQKHPILLTKSHLVYLLIRQTHLDHGHSGNSLTEHLIKEEYWIPALKSQVKKYCRSCPTCVRWKAQTVQPIMGDLPAERITPSPAFSKIGVDLCGPFHIKASAIKFDKIIKVWVAIFVCLVSKAVHLEICSDLSTENFLSAFNRFANRRCWPSLVLSDNGTNFVGANRKIQEVWKQIIKNSKERLAIQEIIWKFNPPYSPNFGGLWEAAVKSMKYFMKRMTNTTNLTYEEFNTLLCRIEGLMNSRPLCPESSNPEDAPALTPFHFVTQRSFKNSAIDAEPLVKTPITKRWLQVHQIQKQFWDRFHQEYLHQLQKRNKWKFPNRRLEVDDLVLIQEPSLTPADWKMGRIIEIYPDTKGDVRRVDVKTTKREVVHRATNRLVPLFPMESDEEPALRRSQRTQNKSTSLLTRVLLCWLALTTPTTKALQIQSLPPGINIQRLGSAAIKAFDLDFSVETTLNITADFYTIDTHLKEFNDFCNQYEKSKYTKLYQHCKGLEKAIFIEGTTVKKAIRASYHRARPKRFIIPVVAKVALKYAPHLLATAGIAYQAVENYRLEHQIANLKGKISSVSKLMTKITDLEFEAVDTQLNELIEQQQQLLIEEQINDYSASIQLLITTIQTNHQGVINVRPIDTLKTYVSRLNNGLEMFRLPEVADPSTLFTYNEGTKSLNGEMVVVSFRIPLVQMKTYTHYAVISVPTLDSHAILLDNTDFVQEIVLSSDNTSFFDPHQAVSLEDDIYDNLEENVLENCMKEIMKSPSSVALLEICTSKPVNTEIDKIFVLKNDLAVVFRSSSNAVNIVCNNTIEPIMTRVNLVKFPGCRISSDKFNIISTGKDVMKISSDVPTIPTEDLSPPKIDIETVHPINPRLAVLKAELKDELDDPHWTSEISQYWYVGVLFIMLIIILVLVIIVFKQCRNRTVDLPGGNYLTKEDKQPGSWVQAFNKNRVQPSIIS